MKGYTAPLHTPDSAHIDTHINTYINNINTCSTSNPVPDKATTYTTDYTSIINKNSDLTGLIQRMVSTIATATPQIERYNEAIHPEQTTKSREVMGGLIPNLRPASISYLLSASVFMALLSIFIIFQMMGVSGQLNLPPALLAWWATGSGSVPFYKNPMVLGGVIILLMAVIMVVGVGYYRKTHT